MLRRRAVERSGAKILGRAHAVLRPIVIDARLRTHFDDGQGLVAQNADRTLAPDNFFFDQYLGVMPQRFRERVCPFLDALEVQILGSIVFGIFIPIAGKLAERFGRREILMLTTVLIGLFSFLLPGLMTGGEGSIFVFAALAMVLMGKLELHSLRYIKVTVHLVLLQEYDLFLM